MGFWGKLFGSDTVIEKTVDGIYNGVDKLVYTEEEKADMRIKAADRFLSLLKAYEPFKLAQRFLALIIAIPYVLVWMLSAGLLALGGVYEVNTLIDTAKDLATYNNETLGQPLSIILAFYFTGGMLEGAISKWKGEK